MSNMEPMTLEEVARDAMYFVKRHWAYYDRDWGRTRCHFCGHSDRSGGGEAEITHADNCEYVRLTAAYQELTKREEEAE